LGLNTQDGARTRMTGLEIWGREKALLELNYLAYMYESDKKIIFASNEFHIKWLYRISITKGYNLIK
jgi:hypothetical protein